MERSNFVGREVRSFSPDHHSDLEKLPRYAQAARNFYVFSYATRARRCQLQIAGSMVSFLPFLERGKVRPNPPSPEHVSQVLHVKLKCLQINCNISKSSLQQKVRQAAFCVVDSPSKPYSYLTSTITSSEKMNIL